MRVRVRKIVLAVLIVVLGLAAAVTGVTAQQAPPPTPAPQQPASPPTAPTPPAQTAPAVPVAPPVAQATPPPKPVSLPPELVEPVARLSKSLESAEKSIQQIKELEGELSRLRSEVERIIYDSTSTAETLRPQLAEVKSQIEKLGPPPNKDQPPESAVIAGERQRLNEMAAALDGALKTTELAWVRAKQLIDRITVIRYQQFTRNLLERRDSPVTPGVWRDVSSRIGSIAGRLQYYGADWMDWASRKSGLLTALLGASLGIFAIGKFTIGSFVQRRLPTSSPSPSFFARVMKAAWVAPLRVLPLGLAAAALYFGLEGLDLLYGPWERPGVAIAQGLIVLAVASALLATALAPRHPQWRLFPVADETARRLLWLLLAFVVVYVLDTVLLEFGRLLYVPLTITVAQSFLTSLLFVGLLVALLLTPFRQLIGPDRPVNGHEFVPRVVTRHTPLWLKLPLWAIAAAILIASALGYVALGRFIAHQLVLSGIVLLAAGLLYLAIRAATRGRADASDMVGNALERQFGLDAARRRQLSRLVELTLSLLLALVALPALLVQWGFSGADIRDWLKALLFGFEIGTFKISLVRILLGIGLFTGLLFLTRVIQRWFREKVTTEGRFDAGVANSIDTAIGYAGTALAMLVAVSYAGFDITSLAIVASALAVGVGFGLQSIVNNFVSGLILLVERPIKVGDWITVGSEQGNVRRISVRSTEIETFDRASLIVPNSELITGRVLNWTHRNLLGRVVVKVKVDPDADPDQVLEILRQCSDGHPDALPGTKPFVTFDNFSGDGLEFTTRLTLADVNRAGAVGTEIRVAILKALREAGVLTRNPQFDIHLRDLDFIKAIAHRLAEQRTADAQAQAAPTVDAAAGAETNGQAPNRRG
ncbi:MAG: DUF3772 domain-containing protein [Hyphomicrobiaceae bacterium]